MKKKRDETFKKYGLEVNESMQFENMPREIQKAEQNYQEGVYKLNDVKRIT